MDRYFLRLDVEGTEWREVSLAQFVDAECRAGFRGGDPEQGRTATASFSGNGISGRVEYGSIRTSDTIVENAGEDEPCIWVYQPEQYGSHDYWQTSCGNAFVMSDGTPTMHDMRFCPYCGRRLKEKEQT